MTKLTPWMQQYQAIKDDYQDAILFFRMGDFYETFFQDAETTARVLDITLTARDKSREGGPIPLAGIPYHALDSYLYKMIRAGHKVAICEQVEDPKQAKGIVKREVVRVVTPGTVTDPKALDRKSNNHLVAFHCIQDRYGFASVDLSTGEFAVTELENTGRLLTEITRLAPSECLLSDEFPDLELLDIIKRSASPVINRLPHWRFDFDTARQRLLDHFKTLSLDGFGCEGLPGAIQAAGALIHYIYETQMQEIHHIQAINTYAVTDYMVLDADAQRNLELTRSIRDGSSRGTLVEILDATLTPMGGRRLRQCMLQPLIDPPTINARLNAVEEMHTNISMQEDIREALKNIVDIERLISRICLGSANARDLLALKGSLEHLPVLSELLQDAQSSMLQVLQEQMDPMHDVAGIIEQAIDPEAPVSVREGRMIRDGYHAELDRLRQISSSGKDWITSLQQQERERTGITSLKIGYNQVFGYYIEVTKPNLDLVPEDYIRKQTLTNSERFITPDLKEQESQILNAQEQIHELEYELFSQVRQSVAAQTERIQKVAAVVGMLDVLAGLASVSAKQHYVRPVVNDSDEIIVKDGRHPVVEQLFTREGFVPNDTQLNCGEQMLHIITGPNMSGKCVSGDTLVFTDQGLVEIKELRPSSAEKAGFTPCEVGVTNGRRGVTASHFYDGGQTRTIQIHTQMGFEIEGTPGHRLWVRQSDGSESWRQLDALREGDALAIPRGMELWGNSVKVHTEMGNLKNAKRYPLPSELSEELAYLMGLLIGDGTLTYRDALNLSTTDASIAEETARIVRECFDYSLCRKQNGKDYYIASVQIRRYFLELGLDYWTAAQKRIPQTILSSPRGIVVGFLQGLFDADGFATKRYGNVRLASASKQLVRQVQMLLLNMDIIGSITVKQTSHLPSYRLSIDGEDSIRFYEEVGFRLPRKQKRQELASPIRHPNKGGIPYLGQLLKEIQRRIVSKTDKPLALKKCKSVNSIFYTYLPNKRNVSYAKVRELIDYCHLNEVDCAELETVADNGYFYVAVDRITQSEAEVFDLSVPDGHAFVANGFINHNSTYLRQTALITLMAQMGSFVPASAAKIGVVDRIFTRVGASDNLVMGQSTFLVEMNETANILNNATERSLIILDEIGRGTSTFDGLSIAWAVAEYILLKIKAKTLFATHYHELIELPTKYPQAKNYNVAVHEDGEQIIFLRKVVVGGTDDSYGIHVARLAGLPTTVIERATQILRTLEQHNVRVDRKAPTQRRRIQREALRGDALQLSLIKPAETHPVVEELRQLELDNMTPIQALTKLYEIKAKVDSSK